MRRAVIPTCRGHGKRLFFRRHRAGVVAAWALGIAPLVSLRGQVGAVFETLTVQGAEYRQVKVLSVTASMATIRYDGGLAQIPLKNLPESLHARFDFDPARAAAYEEALAEEERQRVEEAAAREEQMAAERWVRSATGGTSALRRAMARFGQPVALSPVDLRQRYRAFEFGTKAQGYRPSCAAFAVVGALEYQNALATERAEKLSEEYVIWATRRTLGLAPGEIRRVPDTDDSGARDAGFSLGEVLAAVRVYGVPLQSEMPNTFGLGMEKIADPSEAVIASAQARSNVAPYLVPGHNNDARLTNILHVLNEGVPVVVAMRWPHGRTLRQPLLSQQSPVAGYFHAVTLVGYTVEDGRPETLRFIFRNSWGIRWGVGGYGFADVGYMRANLLEAVVLEVRA